MKIVPVLRIFHFRWFPGQSFNKIILIVLIFRALRWGFSSLQLTFRPQRWSSSGSTAIWRSNAVSEQFTLFKILFHIHPCCHVDNTYSFTYITTYSVAVSMGKADVHFATWKRLLCETEPHALFLTFPVSSFKLPWKFLFCITVALKVIKIMVTEDYG